MSKYSSLQIERASTRAIGAYVTCHSVKLTFWHTYSLCNGGGISFRFIPTKCSPWPLRGNCIGDIYVYIYIYLHWCKCIIYIYMCVVRICIHTYVYMLFCCTFSFFDMFLGLFWYLVICFQYTSTPVIRGRSLGVTALSPRAFVKGSIGRFKHYARLTLDIHRCKNARTSRRD